jgi:hypothetical protein
VLTKLAEAAARAVCSARDGEWHPGLRRYIPQPHEFRPEGFDWYFKRHPEADPDLVIRCDHCDRTVAAIAERQGVEPCP